MAEAGKVVALISRMGPSGPEICVFEHPLAGVQLPAGTLDPGEDPVAGALREAFEETGLAQMDVTGEVARLPTGKAQSRHIVHMGFRGSSANEWWVITPDGGWLCWRCFWLPAEHVDRLHPGQRDWFRVAEGRFRDLPHPPAQPAAVHAPGTRDDLTVEFFFAPPMSADRVRITWLEKDVSIADEQIGRCEVVAFTDEGSLVVVAEDDPGALGLPGGRRDPGESLEDTLRRELREEACAELLASEPIGFQRFEWLEGPNAGARSTDAMFWARVRCDEFQPRFETKHRRLASVEEARAWPLWSHPLAQRQLDRALAVEEASRQA